MKDHEKKLRILFGVCSFVLFVTGILLLSYFVHWTAPVGVFLMMWAYNWMNSL